MGIANDSADCGSTQIINAAYMLSAHVVLPAFPPQKD
jgi:hypothetical protein